MPASPSDEHRVEAFTVRYYASLHSAIQRVIADLPRNLVERTKAHPLQLAERSLSQTL